MTSPRHNPADIVQRRVACGPRCRRGAMLLDAGFGLTILTILTVTFAYSLSLHRQAMARLGTQRELVAFAEQTLNTLRSGVPVPTPPGITVAYASRASDDRATPDGTRWLRVTVSRDGQSAMLEGLVPASAAARVAPAGAEATP